MFGIYGYISGYDPIEVLLVGCESKETAEKFIETIQKHVSERVEESFLTEDHTFNDLFEDEKFEALLRGILMTTFYGVGGNYDKVKAIMDELRNCYVWKTSFIIREFITLK